MNMKFLSIYILAVLVTGCLTTGCKPNEVKLDERNSGRRIELAKGQVLAISLKANPTTGYTWEVVEIDKHVLEQEGEAEFKPQSDLIGAPGVETFSFRAVNAGETFLKLGYRRPWEKDVETERTFSLRVIVR